MSIFNNLPISTSSISRVEIDSYFPSGTIGGGTKIDQGLSICPFNYDIGLLPLPSYLDLPIQTKFYRNPFVAMTATSNGQFIADIYYDDPQEGNSTELNIQNSLYTNSDIPINIDKNTPFERNKNQFNVYYTNNNITPYTVNNGTFSFPSGLYESQLLKDKSGNFMWFDMNIINNNNILQLYNLACYQFSFSDFKICYDTVDEIKNFNIKYAGKSINSLNITLLYNNILYGTETFPYKFISYNIPYTYIPTLTTILSSLSARSIYMGTNNKNNITYFSSIYFTSIIKNDPNSILLYDNPINLDGDIPGSGGFSVNYINTSNPEENLQIDNFYMTATNNQITMSKFPSNVIDYSNDGLNINGSKILLQNTKIIFSPKNFTDIKKEEIFNSSYKDNNGVLLTISICLPIIIIIGIITGIIIFNKKS